VKRTIRSGHNVWCIMERILRDTLEIVWSQLSWFATIKLSLQLRHFVRCLRSLTSSAAGSLATGQCRSFYLEDRFGLPARSNPKDITYFIRFWVGFSSIRQAIKAATQAPVEPKGRIPPTAKFLVFTHHNLAPRNLLLDPSGQLWLLDWDLAGFIQYILSTHPCRTFRCLKTGTCFQNYGGIYSLGPPLGGIIRMPVC
jgi:hypothetical protein